MNYRIETKPQITLLGYKRHFEGTPYDALRADQEEALFVSTRAHQWMLKGLANDKLSEYCVLTNMDDNGYDFYICVTACAYELDNLYNGNVTGIDFMEKFGFEKIIIPERTYAVFETGKQNNPIPEYCEIRKQIAAEWLSNEEYQMTNAPELAVYHWGLVGGCADRTIEIWIPIEKKQALRAVRIMRAACPQAGENAVHFLPEVNRFGVPNRFLSLKHEEAAPFGKRPRNDLCVHDAVKCTISSISVSSISASGRSVKHIAGMPPVCAAGAQNKTVGGSKACRYFALPPTL